MSESVASEPEADGEQEEEGCQDRPEVDPCHDVDALDRPPVHVTAPVAAYPAVASVKTRNAVIMP